MKIVTSRDNPQVKSLRKLAEGAAGRRGEPALLDGEHLCRAWLDHRGPPETAVFDADRLDRPALRALIERLPESACLALESRLMSGLAGVESGQGVLFVVRPLEPPAPVRVEETCVLFDRIQDPGNVGTMLRTCAAAGVKRAFLSAGTAAAWSPKVLRSGQGAHFALHIHENQDLAALLPRLTVPLVATELEGADLYAEPLPEHCAWIFGHEGQGVAPHLLSAARRRVRIPYDHEAVESLNVAAAAAICLFEQRRQRLSEQLGRP